MYLFGVLALILWYALYTYHPGDPGPTQATTVDTIQNGVGWVGAWIADVLFFAFGRPAYLFTVMVFFLGWMLYREQKTQIELTKLDFGLRFSGFLATLFTSHLLGHFERERPSLPALCLASDSASLMAIGAGSGQDEIFSRQVRALGQSGDVLFCIDSAPVPGDSLRRAMQSADERGMAVIALLRNADNAVAGGVTIGVNAARRHRAMELYTMIIHCLCELIDHNLFGPNHQEI